MNFNNNRDELIALYAEYVTLLGREIADAVPFLNKNGRPINPEYLAKGVELVSKISEARNAISAEPGYFWNRYHSHDTDSTAKARAKKVIADAVEVALDKIEAEEAKEIKQLEAEAKTATTLMAKNVKDERAEIASDAKTAAKKVTDAALVAASKV